MSPALRTTPDLGNGYESGDDTLYPPFRIPLSADQAAIEFRRRDLSLQLHTLMSFHFTSAFLYFVLVSSASAHSGTRSDIMIHTVIFPAFVGSL